MKDKKTVIKNQLFFCSFQPHSGGGVCVFKTYVLPTANGHTETEPRFKVSSKTLEKPRIKLMTPGSQGK